MIIKSFELEKLKSLNLKIHLIYGNNEGIKEDIIKNSYIKNFTGEILKYDEQEILNSKDEFLSSLFTKSLFENEKLVIISRATEKLFAIINSILEGEFLETKIIIDLDETLTTFDNGHSKNPKPKNLLTLAEEKTG